MDNSKGQVSMEYVMVTAAMLLILTLLIVIFNGIYSQQAVRAQYLQAQNALSSLSAAATDAWAQGNGSSQQVPLDLPPIAVMAQSNFSNHTMYLYLSGFGDISQALPFSINGSWPAQAGRTLMSVENNGTTILIRPAGRLELDQSSLYLNFSSGSISDATLQLRNRANVSYTVTHALTCPDGVTCGYNATSPITLAPEANQAAVLSISSSIPGLSSGYLTIEAAPAAGSGLPNEEFIVPITVRVD